MKQVSRIAAAIALTTVLGSTAALAQSMPQPSFTGFGVGISLSAVHNSVNVSNFPSDLGNDSSENALTASYGFAMGKDWVGTVALSAGMKDSDYSSYGPNSATARAKNHYSLSFAPGYRLGTDGLLYGKLAFHQMDVNYSNNLGYNRTRTHQGTGLGFGYAHAISQSLEFNLEYEAVQFESKGISSFESAEPKQSSLSVGLTYRF